MFESQDGGGKFARDAQGNCVTIKIAEGMGGEQPIYEHGEMDARNDRSGDAREFPYELRPRQKDIADERPAMSGQECATQFGRGHLRGHYVEH